MARIISFFSLILLLAGFICMQVFVGEPGSRMAKAEQLETITEADTSGVSSALLLEANTGALLYNKKADQKLPMASMTKMMTLRLVFDAIEEGKLKLDQKVKISKNAADQIGSEAFLDAGAEYSIDDLIRTCVIVSANDSSVALAEAVAGSEKDFVKKMNQKAASFGMKNTHFENATGLPAAGHFSTARDMALLAKEVIFEPMYKKYSKTYLDELVHPSGRKTSLVGTNRQLKNYAGFEGGKTGHTNEAGYCIAAAAKRGDMKLVAVVMGGTSSEKRFDAVRNLFDFGFNNFKTKEILKTTKPITKVAIENGKEKEIKAYAKDNFIVFMKKQDKLDYKIEPILDKVKVPLVSGDVVGKVQVLVKGEKVFETDLIVQENYEHVGFKKIFTNLIKAF